MRVRAACGNANYPQGNLSPIIGLLSQLTLIEGQIDLRTLCVDQFPIDTFHKLEDVASLGQTFACI